MVLCGFVNNMGVRGGALFARRWASVDLDVVWLSGNHADEQGGAIFLRENAYLDMAVGYVGNNTAPSIGAVMYLSESTARVSASLFRINNCTDSSDTVRGACLAEAVRLTVLLAHCSLAGWPSWTRARSCL